MPSISTKAHVSGPVCCVDVKGSDLTTRPHAPVRGNPGNFFSGKNVNTQNGGGLSLNPNAEEFIPSVVKSVSSPAKISLGTQFSKESNGKKVLDQKSSIRSDGPDEEHKRYSHIQLPEDLTIDYELAFDNVLEGATGHEQPCSLVTDNFGINASAIRNGCDVRQAFTADQRLQQSLSMEEGFVARNERASPSQTFSSSSLCFNSVNASPYGLSSQQLLSSDQSLFSQRNAEFSFLEDASVDDHRGFAEQQAFSDFLDLQFNMLVTKFPNFSAEILGRVLSANHGDVIRTMEILTQLELQNRVSEQKMQQVLPASDSLLATDFPALPGPTNSVSTSDCKDIQPKSRRRHMELSNTFCRTFDGEETEVDFAAVVRKNSQQRSANQYEKKGNSSCSGGLINSSNNIRYRNVTVPAEVEKDADDIDRNGVRKHTWLETGDVVASLYSDMREEARDHARIRNAYFEQAAGAYLVGNKALAKELSAKGHWHNAQMKAAHGKAGEAIFRQRNNSGIDLMPRQGHPKILDLHGLHVNEAISFLKRELAALRKTARTSSKRQQLLICVGTGHHTKGARRPARLPVAVKRFLLEHEHLQFTETQPGLLQLVL